MKPNYEYAKRQTDMEIWLMHHLDEMTKEERLLFWDLMGEVMRGEIKLADLYRKIKGRAVKE